MGEITLKYVKKKKFAVKIDKYMKKKYLYLNSLCMKNQII